MESLLIVCTLHSVIASRNTDAETRWKLDPTEDHMRRRMKLKRNFKFEDYSQCIKASAEHRSVSSAAASSADVNSALEVLKNIPIEVSVPISSLRSGVWLVQSSLI